jgi:arabinofuranosyltransferase
MLVPQTAIAKEASGSLWARGFTYAGDFVSPYYLWLPLALGVVALAVLLARHRGNPATVLLIATPAVCSLFLTAYVLRIGGDFMHARMLLPPVFLLFLPVFVVPVRATWLAAVAPTAVWALLCLIGFRVSYPNGVFIGPQGIANERLFWVATVGTSNPVTEVPFVRAPWFLPALINQARAQGHAGFGYLSGAGMVLLPGNPDVPWRLGVGVDNIGTGGALLPLDQGMVDPLGLAYPLAAHMRLGERGRPGHEKVIPDAFLLADQTAPGTALPVGAPSQGDVTLARQALGCGRIAELQQAVRAPLTPARFWSNLTGAVGRTSLRIPRDPKDAVAAFCR